MWLNHREFKDFVEQEWGELAISGSYSFIIKEKMKLLKEQLKKRNNVVFGWVDLRLEKAVEEMKTFNNHTNTNVGLEGLLDGKRKEVTAVFFNSLHYMESIQKQKSRVNWLNEGDSNTRFIHNVVKARLRIFILLGIDSPSGRVETVEGVKEEVKHFSKQILKSQH